MYKDGVFLTMAVLHLAVKYTVVAMHVEIPCGEGCRPGWVDRTGTLPERNSHYPPPQPPAQLTLYQGASYSMVNFGKLEWGLDEEHAQ